MKCENCGKNEVTFVYQSNVNGHVTEKHLCADCAEKLGYTQQIAAHSQRMMRNFNNFWGGSLLDDFFTPFPSLLGRMDRMLDNPFDDFFTDMPALGAPAEQAQKPQDTLLEKGEQEQISKARQLNALRLEMQRAVSEENFERAAELRDQIHSLEKN